ncbi:hypothetical protein [Pedobacter sp. CFBP9032]|uniref:hypothetical protein n=1 Tax=Pedobacter sp. CFBP9032 TaxID=3096539 RepID=UPI002A6B2738|nr:hypothetical protein [Pedobacter sp. CFBP9032]MDY0906287.1 hypothetical protein [Pedobacter sp. CFBP9032]
MPRKDINGNDFAPHSDFPVNPEVRNIEFAAGKAFFGKREFPNCFLTDLTIPQVDHFTVHPADYEFQDCHYLDERCDYLNAQTNGRTFDNIIFCNPVQIGFRGRFETKYFLEKAHDLLADDGTLIVLGNSTNKWSKFRNLQRYYDQLKEENDLDYDFKFELHDIDQDHPYRQNHIFYRMDNQVTTPNQLIHIKKA